MREEDRRAEVGTCGRRSCCGCCWRCSAAAAADLWRGSDQGGVPCEAGIVPFKPLFCSLNWMTRCGAAPRVTPSQSAMGVLAGQFREVVERERIRGGMLFPYCNKRLLLLQ